MIRRRFVAPFGRKIGIYENIRGCSRVPHLEIDNHSRQPVVNFEMGRMP
jgi:hypothetical protein